MHSGTRLGIAGCGLIGGSIALRARESGVRVCAYDVRTAASAEALALEVVDDVAESFAELAARSDVLVLAAPLDATLEQLARLERLDSPAELVLDVASVKAPVVVAGRNVAHFVATHPLAGSERSGPSAASAALFEEKTWALVPARDPADGARAAAFVASMGARPFEIAAEDHDRIVALTSHVPQMLSVLLGSHVAGALGDARVLALCGSGMASMLRLGSSAWHVWEPILRANGGPIAQEVRALAAVLLHAAASLEAGNVRALESPFAAAAAAAAALEQAGSLTSPSPSPRKRTS